MLQALITQILDSAPAILRAMSEHPAATDKFLVLVFCLTQFALAWKDRR